MNLSIIKIVNLVNWYFVISLGVLPLIYTHLIDPPFEVPRAWFVWVMTAGLLILTLWKSKIVEYNRSLLLLLEIFLFLISLSSIVNGTLFTSLVGNPYRVDGLISVLSLITLAICIAGWEIKKIYRSISCGVTLGAIIVSMWAIGAYFDKQLIPMSSISMGGVAISFGNPNMLAGYLITSLPFVYLIRRKWIPLVMLGVLVSGSLGGILGIGLWSMATLWTEKKWRLSSLIILMILLIVGVFYLNVTQISTRHVEGIIVAESRERILMKAILAIKERPILGWGWAQFSTAFDSIDWPFHYVTDAYVDKAHSSVLEAGVGGGVVAMFAFILVICISAAKMFQREDEVRSLWIVLLIYFIHSQTNVVSIGEEVLAWIVIGFALSQRMIIASK